MHYIKQLKDALENNGKITILGHDNIDVDSFVSGILLSNFLNFLNIENEFLILEEIQENKTYRIIKEIFRIDMKKYHSEAEDLSRKLLLEAHCSTTHAGKVIGYLDNHLIDCAVVNEYSFYYSKYYSSTSFMIYDLMKNSGYKLSREEAKMIVVSMMINTIGFSNEKTASFEVHEVKKLCKKFNLNYEKLKKYCLCLTPIEFMSIEDIINNGHKYYDFNNYKVKSSYLQLYSKLSESIISVLITNIKKKIISEQLSMWVFIIFDCKENKTYEYRIKPNSTDFEVFKHKGINIPKETIMTEIEKLF